ncbi:MAG TPA: SCO family protein [Candidatus Methylomirabilis sp.]|nr:SCO family protein [Candidatus Methylomirabilis sp.]
MNRRQFVRGASGAALGAAALAASLPLSPAASARQAMDLPPAERRRRRFVNAVLRTQEGDAVRLYDDLLKDKTVLVNFMYTHCTDDCPLTTAKLVQVQKILGERVGRDIFIYSISVDPAHDTPPVLRDYAKTFGVKPGWLFLTGAKADIQRIRSNFGDDPALDFRKSDHLNLIEYGIEPLERWGGFPAWTQPKTMVQYLSWIEPNGDRPGPGQEGESG